MPGRRTIWIIGLLLGAISGHPGNAAAQAPAPDVQQRVEALEARIRELEQQLASARGVPGSTPAPVALPTVASLAPVLAMAAVTNSSPAAPLPTLETLASEIDQLDQRIRIVGRQLELDREQATERAKTTPAVGAGREGFTLRSADGAFQLRLRGYVQSDGRFYAADDGEQGTDTFVTAAGQADHRGDAFQELRRPPHTRLRRGHDRPAGRVRRSPLQSSRKDPRREVQDPVRPRTARLGNRPPVRGACIANGRRAEPRPRRAALRRPAGAPGRWSN